MDLHLLRLRQIYETHRSAFKKFAVFTQVTAITPTKAGEGKTTTTIGLSDGELVMRVILTYGYAL